MKLILILCCVFMIHSMVICQADEYEPMGTIGIHIDQDFFVDYLHNEDRNYTQGTGFSYTKFNQHKFNFAFAPLNLLYEAGERLGKIQNSDKSKGRILELPATLTFGVAAYTPLVLRSYIPEYGDRPYSCLVFIETKRAQMKGRNFHSWSVTYGLLGTNVGKEFQSYAHRNLFQGRGVPLGWDTQISKGGHFTWLIQNTYKVPLRLKKFDLANEESGGQLGKFGVWDASYGIESAFGYYTYFGLNIGARVGKINFLNYNSNQTSFMNSGNKGIGGNTGAQFQKSWEFFFFGNTNPRIWANNTLLQGQRKNSSGYALDSKYVNSLVLESEVGFALSRTVVAKYKDRSYQDKTFLISYSIKHRTAEYSYPGFTRGHLWGSLNVLIPIDVRKNIKTNL